MSIIALEASGDPIGDGDWLAEIRAVKIGPENTRTYLGLVWSGGIRHSTEEIAKHSAEEVIMRTYIRLLGGNS